MTVKKNNPVKIIKKGYGLMEISTGRLLGVHANTVESDGEYGVEGVNPHYDLTTFAEVPWVVGDILTASFVRMHSTEWYNAGYDTPINSYQPEELQVVEIKISAMEVTPAHIPTNEEYLQKTYADPKSKRYDPNHYNYMMGVLNSRGYDGPVYSLYDLQRDGE